LEGAIVDASTLIPVGIRHPLLQQYMALKQRAMQQPEHLAAIEGAPLIAQAAQARLEFKVLFVCPELFRGETCSNLATQILAMGATCYVVSEKVMRRIVEWEGPDGLAAIVALPRFGWRDIALRASNRLLVLDGLEIPGNIGTIIRCADGAGADAVIMVGCKKRRSNFRVLHASMGAAFSFPIIESAASEAIAWLKRHAFTIITTEPGAPLRYREASYQGRVAVVMGNERRGVSHDWREARDTSVSIPMRGRADSLNVGNAAVLLLYEMSYS
jgi:TrmH family RNA methyltransferase